MANLKDVIYLSNEDYATLVSTGTVTIDGVTLTYDENNVYITPDTLASSTEDGLMSAADKAKLDTISSGAEANVQADWNQTLVIADDYIKNKPTLGTAAAKDFTTSVTSGSADLVTSGAVKTAIDALPVPMVFKGTVGTGGTITWDRLPIAAATNQGYTYKVVSDHATAPICKVGDTIISNGSAWEVVPSGDETDTWRQININGTQFKSNNINSGLINLKNGTNITLATNGNDVTINGPTQVGDLTNDRYVRYDLYGQSLSDYQQLCARYNISAAKRNHLDEHNWELNTYYFDDTSRGFRMVTETALGDILRFQSDTIGYNSRQYWDYSSSTWKTWNVSFDNLFDGSGNTEIQVPYANRKFRFEITASHGWPNVSMIVLSGAWFNSGTINKIDGTDAYVIMTIETRANTSAEWTLRETLQFAHPCASTNAYCTQSLHTGDTYYRITIELGPWTQTSNNANLKQLCILSNYQGNSLTPWQYDGRGYTALDGKRLFVDPTLGIVGGSIDETPSDWAWAIGSNLTDNEILWIPEDRTDPLLSFDDGDFIYTDQGYGHDFNFATEYFNVLDPDTNKKMWLHPANNAIGFYNGSTTYLNYTLPSQSGTLSLQIDIVDLTSL